MSNGDGCMAERSTRLTHETILSDNPPEPSQLFRLASYAMSSARDLNTHRVMTKNPHAHYSVQEAHDHDDSMAFMHDGVSMRVKRRVAIRVGRRVMETMPLKVWSLKFFDTSWFERPGGNWAGVRELYRFEWNQRGMVVADKTTTPVPAHGMLDMYDQLKNFSVPDDIAATLRMEQEMTQVTADDCDALLVDIADYFRQTDLLQRKFTS